MNSNPFLKTALNYGAISGLCGFAVFLALYFKGIDPIGNASWLGAWIPIILICIATKNYRDHFLAGEINYGQAFKIGFATAVSGAFLFAFLVYIFATLYDGTIVSTFINEKLLELEQTKFMFSDEFYDSIVAETEKFTIGSIVFNDFFMKSIGAVIVSLVTAAYYRKQHSEMEE